MTSINLSLLVPELNHIMTMDYLPQFKLHQLLLLMKEIKKLIKLEICIKKEGMSYVTD